MARRPLLRLEVPVPLAHALDASGSAAVLSQAVQLLLFMQRQIPCPFDELAQDLERTPHHHARPRARPGGWRRKAALLLCGATRLFAQLPAALSAALSAVREQLPAALSATHELTQPLVVALLLGSSVASPRVVYLFRLLVDPSAEESSRPAARRLLRALATRAAVLTEHSPRACRVFLLLQAPRAARLPAEFFRPRPGLALNLRRAHLGCVDLCAPSLYLLSPPPPLPTSAASISHRTPLPSKHLPARAGPCPPRRGRLRLAHSCAMLRRRSWCTAPIKGMEVAPPRPSVRLQRTSRHTRTAAVPSTSQAHGALFIFDSASGTSCHLPMFAAGTAIDKCPIPAAAPVAAAATSDAASFTSKLAPAQGSLNDGVPLPSAGAVMNDDDPIWFQSIPHIRGWHSRG
ncbi:hypothetical protein AB1Y20_010940 [Prymnesium parvum]|uniref:Uncharacterized protein n=1 Tax=Prymnesium parvum TaxID=97485 RepID=A0AB34IT89_PRYPA